MKLLKKIAKFILLVFVLLQFFNPDKNIEQAEHLKPFIKETNPSKETVSVLEGSCYNCHGNHTDYPWYNNVAPLSFLLAKDIRKGKEKLNFSNWESYTKNEKEHLMEEISLAVQEGSMPLNRYTWLHPDAKLTEVQKEAIVEWASKTRMLYQLGPLPK